MSEHKWIAIEETTPSGKRLFECQECGVRRPLTSRGPCGICEVCGHWLDSIGHAGSPKCRPLTWWKKPPVDVREESDG